MSYTCSDDWTTCDRSYCQRERKCAERAASAPAALPVERLTNKFQSPVAQSLEASEGSGAAAQGVKDVPEEQPVFNRKSASDGPRFLSGSSDEAACVLASAPGGPPVGALAPSDEQPGWQPIETAPKDGSAVLLFIVDAEHPFEDEPNSVSIGSYGVEGGPVDDPTWSFPGWSWHQDCYCKGDGTPTHWMPLPAAPSGVTKQPAPEKYDDVLVPFVALMRNELHDNADKGDRPGWLGMSREQGLLEIYWHTAKLSAAVKNNDGVGVVEHSADVANMAMMLLDICGGLK